MENKSYNIKRRSLFFFLFYNYKIFTNIITAFKLYRHVKRF